MHYGDNEQLRDNLLKIVVYIHEDLSGGKIDSPYPCHLWMVTSIPECRFFSPRILYTILEDPQGYFQSFENTKNLPFDKFLVISLRETPEGAAVLSVQNAEELDDERLFIH